MGGPLTAPDASRDIAPDISPTNGGIKENFGTGELSDDDLRAAAMLREHLETPLGSSQEVRPGKSTATSANLTVEKTPFEKLLDETTRLAQATVESDTFKKVDSSKEAQQALDSRVEEDLQKILVKANEAEIDLTPEQKDAISAAYQKILEQHGASSTLDEDRAAALKEHDQRRQQGIASKVEYEDQVLRKEIQEEIAFGVDEKFIERRYSGKKGADGSDLVARIKEIREEEKVNYTKMLSEVADMARENKSFDEKIVVEHLRKLEEKYPAYMSVSSQRDKLWEIYHDTAEQKQGFTERWVPGVGVDKDADDRAEELFKQPSGEREAELTKASLSEQLEAAREDISKLAETNPMMLERLRDIHLKEIMGKYPTLMNDPEMKAELGEYYADQAEDAQSWNPWAKDSFWKVDHSADSNTEEAFENAKPEERATVGMSEEELQAEAARATEERLAIERGSVVEPTPTDDRVGNDAQPGSAPETDDPMAGLNDIQKFLMGFFSSSFMENIQGLFSNLFGGAGNAAPLDQPEQPVAAYDANRVLNRIFRGDKSGPMY